MSYVDLIGPILLPLILLSSAGCLLMVGSRKGSSSLRRLVASAFLLSLLVVMASQWIRVPEPAMPLTALERVAVRASVEARETWSWQWLFFAPAFYVVLRHLLGLVNLARSRRGFLHGPSDLTSDRLFICGDVCTAYAYGYFKPTIVLPTSYLDLEPAELLAVIRHEEAHLRQGDPTLIPIVNLLQGLLWWNPFVHLLARAWRLESERAADDAALASGIPPARYARQLINLAQGLAGRPPLAGSAFIGRGRLKTRILAVVNPEIRRKNMKSSQKYMTVAGCMAAALALSVAASARWHSAQVVNEKGPEGAIWRYVETSPGHFVWTYEVKAVAGMPRQSSVKEVEGEIFEAVSDSGMKVQGKAVEEVKTVEGVRIGAASKSEVNFRGQEAKSVEGELYEAASDSKVRLRGKAIKGVKAVEGELFEAVSDSGAKLTGRTVEGQRQRFREVEGRLFPAKPQTWWGAILGQVRFRMKSASPATERTLVDGKAGAGQAKRPLFEQEYAGYSDGVLEFRGRSSTDPSRNYHEDLRKGK